MKTYYSKDEVLAMADRLAKLDVYGCNRDGAEMLRAFAKTLGEPVAWKVTVPCRVETPDGWLEGHTKTFVTDDSKQAYYHQALDGVVIPLCAAPHHPTTEKGCE